MGTGDPFPGDKARLRHDIDHSRPFSAEVREWVRAIHLLPLRLPRCVVGVLFYPSLFFDLNQWHSHTKLFHFVNFQDTTDNVKSFYRSTTHFPFYTLIIKYCPVVFVNVSEMLALLCRDAFVYIIRSDKYGKDEGELPSFSLLVWW
jgi:hypothetical protein